MNHSERKRNIGKIALPSEGSTAYLKRIEQLKKYIDSHPENDKVVWERFKKAREIVIAQSENGANLPLDCEIRYFFEEYNYRTFKYGLRSMPSSFNVLESFFDYRPNLNFFELLREEDYFFSVFDFVDYITSPDFIEDKSSITENFSDNLIYHFNILNPLDIISFTTEDGKDYVIGGVSLVRRGKEVSVFLLTGQKTDTEEETREILNSGGQIRAFTPGREKIKVDEERKVEAVKLFGRKDYWKTLAYCRIDLDKFTIDARYVQRDQGNMYLTVTDDISSFIDSAGNLRPQYKEFYETVSKEILSYSPIFEIAIKFLYLPQYFNQFEDKISEENHSTKLGLKKKKSSPFNKKGQISAEYNIKSRTVFSLDISVKKKTDFSYFGESGFKIERSGYWKKLDPTQVGKDKNGVEIHGKTWVEQTNSWYEDSEQTLVAQFNNRVKSNKGTNPGYIYLIRNASHDLNLFKIGLTTLDPKTRAKQLSSTTASPDKFLVANEWYTVDCVLAEKMVHDRLKEFRINANREFFKVDFNLAMNTINEIISMVNA